MNDELYHFIVGILDLFLWSGELVGEDNLPRRGPAVFVANHLDATGPIGVVCSIPLRVHSWTVADMVDQEKAAAYLKWDFVERSLHIQPPLSAWVARRLAKPASAFLRGLGCIPVYKGDYDRMVETLRLSMDELRQDHFLLIFPEDNLLPEDPETRMKPFQHSFARLGEMYYSETRARLDYYPVAVHSAGCVIIGKPVAYNPLNPVGLERHRLKELMECTIRDMYLNVDHVPGSQVAGLTPQHK